MKNSAHPSLQLLLITLTAWAVSSTPPAYCSEASRIADPKDSQDLNQVLTSVDGSPLPSIGKWMVDDSGTVADWLNLPFQNKKLNEPINVIIRIHTTNTNLALLTLLYDTYKA